MIRAWLSFLPGRFLPQLSTSPEWAERLSLDERDGQVGYHYGKGAEEMERMDYLEFVARVTSHIPDKGQVTVRYYGLCANAHRGKVKKATLGPFPLRMVEEELRSIPSKGWAEMIRKVYEVDPMKPQQNIHRDPLFAREENSA